MKDANKWLIVILILFLFSNCTATYNLYKSKNEKKDSDVAIIYKDFDWGIGGYIDQNSIQITQIDDIKAPCKGIVCLKRWFGSSWDGSYEIKLLPGKHTVHVRFKSNKVISVERNGKTIKGFILFKRKVTFDAEPGQKYYVAAEYLPSSKSTKCWIKKMNK